MPWRTEGRRWYDREKAGLLASARPGLRDKAATFAMMMVLVLGLGTCGLGTALYLTPSDYHLPGLVLACYATAGVVVALGWLAALTADVDRRSRELNREPSTEIKGDRP